MLRLQGNRALSYPSPHERIEWWGGIRATTQIVFIDQAVTPTPIGQDTPVPPSPQ
jgi:hypothetical protein